MQLLDETRTFIHTRFGTDGEALRQEDVDTIERELDATLRAQRLWATARVHGDRDGISIVITCQPAGEDLRVLRARIVELLDPLPIRPRPPRITIQPQGPYR